MRPLRLLALACIAALYGVLLVGCSAESPGWTYQPAPSVTPAPSVEESAAPSGDVEEGQIAVSALGIAFEQATVNVPAGEDFQIVFANNDPGVPHNVAIRRDDANGEEVFTGDIFNGVETMTYDVPALDGGAYVFICTVHPNMIGSLTAE